jgi:hypothetical protein
MLMVMVTPVGSGNKLVVPIAKSICENGTIRFVQVEAEM